MLFGVVSLAVFNLIFDGEAVGAALILVFKSSEVEL